jgi:DNA-binding CsgD family transcriptional regulator
VGRLRELTSPLDILAAAPEQLCGCSRLDRAVLSLIRNGFLVAHAAWFTGDARGATNALDALRADPPRLEHPMVESELLRRRRATLVSGARVHPRMAEAMGWDSYVAAPVLLGDAIAVIHADRRSGPALDVLDGDVLWSFANGVADAFESASLRRALRTQRSEMRAFVEWLGARSGELSDPTMELLPGHEPTPEPPGSLDVIASASRVDDRVVFEDVLTRRELDVLRLLVRGESNQGIAAQLVISAGTVKFHVGNILDKLRVSNRAEAVSRYHRLVEMGPREDA